MKKVKAISKQRFADREEANLFTLKSLMLDHISEDLLRFGNLRLLGASYFEHFSCTLKNFIRMIVMREATLLEELPKQGMDLSKKRPVEMSRF